MYGCVEEEGRQQVARETRGAGARLPQVALAQRGERCWAGSWQPGWPLTRAGGL